MTCYLKLLGAVTAAGLVALSALPAKALTAQECSAKYQAAKSAGTLDGQKWNDFRKAHCGAAAPTAPEAAETSAPKTANPSAASAGNAVFPSPVSSKYASEPAGKARRHTCLDQYRANKTSNSNGGLKWIMKGGGYYSECSKRLKGV
ncbi:hypothetical protein NB311A_02014 [Nitrobacter sp. Nb-311A]|uniref:hypothetical protein n=1 Tax=unclassified Nitrobacter TaxID=2620411 RepID=UPI000068800C|nr:MULTISPECIES: hypothetical protein [unclassified Nitrobacter]EAQ36241.1 hypothetical protein NB311A_02014 [Nitrobacter sp. Nb-311A]MCB1393696.1 hypothetical protein [Nitrobacter sp.]MCV0387302.1 hypothetical protein [Nitrobacter sp.]